MDALRYAQDLVRFPTVSSSSNADISEHLGAVLARQGFSVERIPYTDPMGVAKVNLVGRKGAGEGGMAYFGHTDVVPARAWTGPADGPFDPTVTGDRLYGRGSCDMKGSIACMLAAVDRTAGLELRAPLYLALTADEEVGYLGASEVARRSEHFQEMVATGSKGIVGEPTMLEVVHAHKGTCGFRATARGRAAHSSTDQGINANLAMIPFLVEMKRIHDETREDPAWQDRRFDPPGISWNIGINDHTAAVNVTPDKSVCTVYFRPAPGQDETSLFDRSRAAARECGLEFEVLGDGGPLHVDPDSSFVREVLGLAGRTAPRTVCYGTDGAVLGDLEHLLVLGPGDIAQAHTADEWIRLEQLDKGTDLFARLIQRWCA